MKEMYDIIVGIPSFKEASTIGHVVRVVGQGLARYFPDTKSIIVNVDNSSPDDTKFAFLSANIPVGIDKKYISTPEGVRGKGNNFRNLFHFVMGTKAKIIIVVDADLQSITPEWIQYLGYPIQEGYDFVAPFYSRHQFDGTITNHLCYPLLFSLVNINIRQPIGGEFAFSPRLCAYWLEQQWSEDVKNFGIDIFMSLHAALGNFSICEAGLGTKIHNPSAPKLGKMFEEVVHTLFATLLQYRSTWLGAWLQKKPHLTWISESRSVNRYGLQSLSEPQPVAIDIMKLKSDCYDEYQKYHDLVKQYLSPYAYQKIHSMFEMDFFDVDIMLWSQIVYSLFHLYDEATPEIQKDIINILKPLYFARSISFDYQTYRYSLKFAEEEVKNQAMAFLSQKPYLLGLYLKEKIISGIIKPEQPQSKLSRNA